MKTIRIKPIFGILIISFLSAFIAQADTATIAASIAAPTTDFTKPTLTNNGATEVVLVAYTGYKQATPDNVDGKNRINKVGIRIPPGGVVNFPDGTVEFDVWYGSRDAISTIFATNKSYTIVPSADKWTVEFDDKFK